jgi:hypothetical protein
MLGRDRKQQIGSKIEKGKTEKMKFHLIAAGLDGRQAKRSVCATSDWQPNLWRRRLRQLHLACSPEWSGADFLRHLRHYAPLAFSKWRRFSEGPIRAVFGKSLFRFLKVKH